ncbi:MAG TPA: hypothetical protein HPP81_01895 [Deltaproteobacteria bacterium]|nr:hypothetical protein [Deltaproteobacteria bacterium]
MALSIGLALGWLAAALLVLFLNITRISATQHYVRIEGEAGHAGDWIRSSRYLPNF